MNERKSSDVSTFKTTTVNRFISLHFLRPLPLKSKPPFSLFPAHISTATIGKPMSSSIPSVQPGRIRVLKQAADPKPPGPVVYWMFRDQRLKDNWALIHAVHQANQWQVPVAIAFNLFHQFKGAKARHLGFMLRGLKQLHSDLHSTLDLPFFLFQVSNLFCFFQINYWKY